MELREIKSTAEVEFETADGLLKFTVQYIPGDRIALDYINQGRISDRMRAAVAEAIVGWNLAHDDGTAWPCDAETKAKLLPQLVVLQLKSPIPPGISMLGLALFEFIGDPGNFLKN